MRIAILTDSTSGLTSYQADDRPHAIVPLTVALGDIVYSDGIDIAADTFYPLIAATRMVATTAQPPPAVFLDAYHSLAADGYDTVVSIHCARVLSGTVQSATEAARHAPIAVTVVDTHTIGAALGVSVRAAVRAVNAGAAADEVVARATTVARHSGTYFIVDDLDHLRRGGRLKAGQAAIGQALHVKPLLHIDSDGHVAVAQRHRTWQRAITQLAVYAHAAFNDDVHAVIAHAAAPERAAQIERQLRDTLRIVSVEHDVIGPVVGAHVGGGAAGVALIPTAVLR